MRSMPALFTLPLGLYTAGDVYFLLPFSRRIWEVSLIFPYLTVQMDG